MKSFTGYQARIPDIINNSQGTNVAWATELVNDSLRYLVTKYYFNERSYTVPGGTVAQQQFYNLPPQVKKILNLTVTIGGVKWQPIETASRSEWDNLNVITFYQDYPSKFFVFNGQVGIFPIPATSGSTITINYKTRIPDLSMADVTDTTTGNTMTATNGTTTLVATTAGTTVTFSKWMQDSGWIRIPHNSTDTKNGDNQWYQIASVASGTTAFLANQYNGTTATAAAFTIGDFPILPEDYEDLPLYRMANIYYTTRFPDPSKSELYQALWDKGVQALDEEFSSKTTGVALPEQDQPYVNPNLFQRSVS